MKDPYTGVVVVELTPPSSSVIVVDVVELVTPSPLCCSSLMADDETMVTSSNWSSDVDIKDGESLSTMRPVPTHLYSPSSSCEMDVKRNADPMDWWIKRRRRRRRARPVASKSAPWYVAHLSQRTVTLDTFSTSGRWHCSVNPWPLTASTIWTWPSWTVKQTKRPTFFD